MDSWRGPWRAVGDNAHLALESWNTLSGHIPLVGQPNELPGAPHDLGPLQYWLLTIPVHLDTNRGVLWGAVLLVMAAASLAVEAGYSVRGELGGLVAGGFFIAMVTWFPGFASRPEDNPNFGTLIFVPTVAVCVAVLAGRRRWWPVLVVMASVAAQAHLMFAAASVGLVLIGAVAGVVDERRAEGHYSWLAVGLVTGAVCWFAPLEQQVFSAAGQGNMSLLLHADHAGSHLGIGYALRAMGSLAVPSPLWWQQNISQRHHLFQALGTGSAVVGLVVLALTVAGLAVAVWWLRSRVLAGLAGVSLLVGVTAVIAFARIPGNAGVLAKLQHDLVFVMFIAVLLAWLAVVCVAVGTVVKLIGDRREMVATASAAAAAGAAAAAEGRRSVPVPALARGAATLLLLTVTLVGVAWQVSTYPGAGTNSQHVSAALPIIERALPGQRAIALSVSSPGSSRFQVLNGLCWALSADGYQASTFHPEPTRTKGSVALPEAIVVLHGRTLKVKTTRTNPERLGRWSPCAAH